MRIYYRYSVNPLESAKLRATRAVVSYVPRALCTLVLHMTRIICALAPQVSHVHRDLPAPVPHMPRAICALVLDVLHALHALILYVPPAWLTHVIGTIHALVLNQPYVIWYLTSLLRYVFSCCLCLVLLVPELFEFITAWAKVNHCDMPFLEKEHYCNGFL